MTTTLPESSEQTGSRLLWALRFHARALVAAALFMLFLTSVAVGRLALAPPTYTATASVIATELEFSAERLPRLAEAIYQQDSVLAEALRLGQLPWSVDVLRDEHSKVTPLEDNVLVIVDGQARSSELAVRTANAVAEALSAAFNRSGTEAVFAVQERATRASRDDVQIPVGVTVVAGIVATTAFVLGLAGLLLAMNRPVTRPMDAAAVTGVPVLTVVEVPRHARPILPLRGLDALQRALFARDIHVVVMTTTADGTALRTAVSESYAYLLSLDNPVTFVPVQGGLAAAEAGLTGTTVTLHDRAEVLPSMAGSVVVDGFDDEQAAWRESLPPNVGGVVVVPEGAPQVDLAAVMDRFVPGDLAGLVFVSRIGGRRRHRRRGTGRVEPSRWADRSRLAVTAAAAPSGTGQVRSAVAALHSLTGGENAPRGRVEDPPVGPAGQPDRAAAAAQSTLEQRPESVTSVDRPESSSRDVDEPTPPPATGERSPAGNPGA